MGLRPSSLTTPAARFPVASQRMITAEHDTQTFDKTSGRSVRVAKEKVVSDISLGEAASQYVAALPPAAAPTAQRAVTRFVQWFGPEKRLTSLTTVDIERFVEESAGRGGSQGRNID